MRDQFYTGWKRNDKGNRHFYRGGTSLCGSHILFENSKDVEGGKDCPKCQKRLDELPPERVPLRIVEI